LFLPTAAATRLNAGFASISLRRNGATVSLVVAAPVCDWESPFVLGSGLRIAAGAACRLVCDKVAFRCAEPAFGYPAAYGLVLGRPGGMATGVVVSTGRPRRTPYGAFHPKNLSSHHGDHGGHGETAQAYKIQAHPTGDMLLLRNALFFSVITVSSVVNCFF
jgi:hypothetical protein